jgi:hypothetical protein
VKVPFQQYAPGVFVFGNGPYSLRRAWKLCLTLDTVLGAMIVFAGSAHTIASFYREKEKRRY